MMNKFYISVSDRTWGHWSRFLLRPSEDSWPIPLVIVFCVALGWKNHHHHHHHQCYRGQNQHHNHGHRCHHQVKTKVYDKYNGNVIDNLMISSCCWYRKCLRCYQSARWPIFLYLLHDLDGCLCIATLQIAPKENFIDDTSASSSWSLGQSRPTAVKA